MAVNGNYELPTLYEAIVDNPKRLIGQALIQNYGSTPADMVTVQAPIYDVYVEEPDTVAILTENAAGNRTVLRFGAEAKAIGSIYESDDLWFSDNGHVHSGFGILPDGQHHTTLVVEQASPT